VCNTWPGTDDRVDVHWDAILITAVTGAVTVGLGMFANWVARPKWAGDHPRWVVAAVVGLAAVSMGITVLVGPTETDKQSDSPETFASAPASTVDPADASPAPLPEPTVALGPSGPGASGGAMLETCG